MLCFAEDGCTYAAQATARRSRAERRRGQEAALTAGPAPSLVSRAGRSLKLTSAKTPRSGDPTRAKGAMTPHFVGAFRESMQHEPDEEVSWCDDVARA